VFHCSIRRRSAGGPWLGTIALRSSVRLSIRRVVHLILRHPRRVVLMTHNGADFVKGLVPQSVVMVAVGQPTGKPRRTPPAVPDGSARRVCRCEGFAESSSSDRGRLDIRR
jgi:hypothetical protein